MPKELENPEVTELENETVSDPTAQKRIARVADKAAGKASHTEQVYEKDEKIISI